MFFWPKNSTACGKNGKNVFLRSPLFVRQDNNKSYVNAITMGLLINISVVYSPLFQKSAHDDINMLEGITSFCGVANL